MKTPASENLGMDPELRPRAEGASWRAWAVVLAVLLVFGAVVASVSLELRDNLRAQVLTREGEVLAAVAAMQDVLVEEDAEALVGLEADRALEVALHTSKLRGVLAVRLFDSGGSFRDSVPAEVDESILPPADLALLVDGHPVVRFHPRFALGDLFLSDTTEVVPLLEVTAPFVGAGGDPTMIQFWIDGHDVAREFARLDRRVARQSAIAFLAGAALIAGSLAWAFRRLARINRDLHRHAMDLARANRELAQSARTSALGTITAHLMHSMRNPLAGLEDLVSTQTGSGEAAQEGEWESARESTRRLRSLVNEVQALLSDLSGGAEFEITLGELCAGVRERVGAFADRRGVAIEVRVADVGPGLGSREGGLAGLVLANLVQNALEASAAGSHIIIESVGSEPGFCDLVVIDQGCGLPADVAADPFRPRRSTKPDGAGIGLAISRELARHAGGKIELLETGPQGTTFRLRLPTRALRQPQIGS